MIFSIASSMASTDKGSKYNAASPPTSGRTMHSTTILACHNSWLPREEVETFVQRWINECHSIGIYARHWSSTNPNMMIPSFFNSSLLLSIPDSSHPFPPTSTKLMLSIFFLILSHILLSTYLILPGFK